MGRKGLQLIMDAKLQNSCHLAASTASGQEQGPGLGARCPLLSPQSPGASDLGRLKVLRVRPLGPGQVPKRGVEWGAGGLGSMGVASAPGQGRAQGWGGVALSCGPGDGRAVLLGLHAEGRDA